MSDSDSNAPQKVLRLYVAGDDPNSQLARENLARICKEIGEGHRRIEIVDILEDFQAALDNQVVLTPTLVLLAPGKRTDIIGNLSQLSADFVGIWLSSDDGH